MERELELDEAGTALIYLCDLVDSTAFGTVHSTNIYHMSSGSDGALRIKNEYTLILYTN